MSPQTPVWITGVGVATPLGHDYRTIADALLAGRSGIAPIQGFETSQHPSRIAGQLAPLSCPSGVDAAAFDALLPLDQLVLWCVSEALRDSGWWDRRSTVRIGVVLGLGAEWVVNWEVDGMRGGERMFRHEPDAVPLVESVARRLGLRGPTATVSSACASGNTAIGLARRWLRMGWADVCLAGACDRGVSPLGMAGFGNLRALSRRNDEPQRASRPFDRGRDGFVLSEGGAVYVLEPADTARKRTASVRAEVAGCGASSDAYHLVIPCPDPTPAAVAMRRALADAQLNPSDLDYLNAHATSTPAGDAAEARVLADVFGPAVTTIPVSSTKSMTGHLLTAAAAMEAVACLAAMERGAVPPTINLDDPDPECALCHVPHTAQERPVRAAASNSFGFGGSNTCLILKAV